MNDRIQSRQAWLTKLAANARTVNDGEGEPLAVEADVTNAVLLDTSAQFNRECDDADKIFTTVLGWPVEQFRSEGGSLNVGRLITALRPPQTTIHPPAAVRLALDALESGADISQRRDAFYALRDEFYPIFPRQQIQKDEEIVICAAVKTVEGKIIHGHRHDGAMEYAIQMGLTLVPYEQNQQGFVTSRGRYVDRVEAAALQKAAGIKSVDHENRVDFPTELFSEDLHG